MRKKEIKIYKKKQRKLCTKFVRKSAQIYIDLSSIYLCLTVSIYLQVIELRKGEIKKMCEREKKTENNYYCNRVRYT